MLSKLPSPSRLLCRPLNAGDIADIVSLHNDGFPNGALTAFGRRCVEKYYLWHMRGPHAVAAIGLELDGVLIGYSVLIRHNDFSGFLLRALPTLAWTVLRAPWLALRRGFASRLRGGLGLLLG